MALIGISGKKHHGKDLVANIIQFIVFSKGTTELTEENFLKWNEFNHLKLSSIWRIKKYAYKLKQIVSLMIGCSMEDLENEEFKNKPIEGWDRYVIHNLVGERFIFSKAGDLINHIDVVGDIFTDNPEEFRQKITPRILLQEIGTDCFRNIIHPNVWVNGLFSDYKPKFRGGGLSEDGVVEGYPNWLITDVRFPNEVDPIEERFGFIIRVDRPGIVSNDNHPSEIALDNHKFKWRVINDGTIEDLIPKIEHILQEEKII